MEVPNGTLHPELFLRTFALLVCFHQFGAVLAQKYFQQEIHEKDVRVFVKALAETCTFNTPINLSKNVKRII